MTRLIDISPRVHAGTAVWPGDVAFSRSVVLSIANGDNLELSAITTTVHIGAHTDAPSHYVAGPAIDARDPALYFGPCQVVTAAVGRGARIAPSDLSAPVAAPRVLLRTGTFPDPDRFDEDFAALSVELVHHLADAGVRLVGIDTPSVDLCHDAELHAHHAIADRDLAILEGIVLDGVEDGLYTLVALPLRLAGCDASPVRAMLFTDPVADPLRSPA
ncbi:MAG: cyclase family protein [Alphaproteobacteria bacterium]|nr:cyclase family protein [Alphaproteobacteria bacterium]